MNIPLSRISPTSTKPGDTVVRRPRESEIAPITLRVERRLVSVRGPTSPMVLIYGFLGVILIGTLLLMLPVARGGSEVHNFGDRLTEALFTATSAVAVTGLVVVDTAEGWSMFGQSVIMVLFFIGGLGFMTGAAFLLMIVGQRIGLQSQLLLRSGLGEAQLGAIASLVRKIVIFSILTQAVGVLLLFLRWYVFGELWEGITFGEALWQSTFHSISAFNNAGFEILPDSLVGGPSLEPFTSDIPLLLIMAALIIIGGLSYFVLADVASQRRFRRLRLDTKLVLVGSLGLLAVGTGVFLATEWSHPNSIGAQSVPEKLTDSFFHSAAARTAGFSTVDYGEISGANLLGTQALMFIGGASTSTAGGIKVTTFMVIMISVAATLRGRRRVNAFGRELPAAIVQRAMVVGAAATAMLIALFAILVSVQPELDFRQALFEVVSAFGTVGLSTGITSDLNTGARIVITVAMFVGRFGPLALALLMAGRELSEPYRLTTERVRIG
ncbi:MAG: Trk family potassium uptake protein [Chloroflexi bacterium]|nr:Trk family potassium uptake protein [Chloroflexota bacterium]